MEEGLKGILCWAIKHGRKIEPMLANWWTQKGVVDAIWSSKESSVEMYLCVVIICLIRNEDRGSIEAWRGYKVMQVEALYCIVVSEKSLPLPVGSQ